MMTDRTEEIRARIGDYLVGEGLFKPELGGHHAVHGLIIDCRDVIDAKDAEIERLREALEWYGEQAEAMNRYASANPPKTEAMMAVVASMSLDAGTRAALAKGTRS